MSIISRKELIDLCIKFGMKPDEANRSEREALKAYYESCWKSSGQVQGKGYKIPPEAYEAMRRLKEEGEPKAKAPKKPKKPKGPARIKCEKTGMFKETMKYSVFLKWRKMDDPKRILESLKETYPNIKLSSIQSWISKFETKFSKYKAKK